MVRPPLPPVTAFTNNQATRKDSQVKNTSRHVCCPFSQDTFSSINETISFSKVTFLTIENNNHNIHSDPSIKCDSILNSCDVLNTCLNFDLRFFITF